ncbi:MAG: dihydrolipoyl dehydrogenase [Desulfuromonadaceae bacterium]|nr:dihydrolipoyl dehydrogenase [Desulfuromonadaceae bacterium]MDD5107078.1 dihydrolipoyl dehydrogenase [Desulfuromonadaceae bacterium]
MADIFDLIVIGAGPGGYVAAIRAAQLGMTVAMVEKRATMGGVCLNEGCIPSKALLDSSELFAQIRDKSARHGIIMAPPQLDLAALLKRKQDVVKKLADGIAALFKKNDITIFSGTATLKKGSGGAPHAVLVRADAEDAPLAEVTGKRVLLATGSTAVEIPGLPFDGVTVVSAREALDFSAVPVHLLVVGAGYIGLELGSVWRRLGAEVTVVEALAKPMPASDGQVADTLVRSLRKQGFTFKLETRVISATTEGSRTRVVLEGPSGREELVCDKILVAAGRRPLTADIGLEDAGVQVGKDGRVVVDHEYTTTVPGIYAVGDIIAGPMLAHKASEEGVVCIERMTGLASEVEYDLVPGIAYTWPEAASVGKTEEQLKAVGVEYDKGQFNFVANGRAKCMDETEGFVKILASRSGGRILGVHIVGPRASDIIAEAVTAMTFGATAQDLAMTFHAHPTLAEAMKEAALDVEKRSIHS